MQHLSPFGEASAATAVAFAPVSRRFRLNRPSGPIGPSGSMCPGLSSAESGAPASPEPFVLLGQLSVLRFAKVAFVWTAAEVE